MNDSPAEGSFGFVCACVCVITGRSIPQLVNSKMSSSEGKGASAPADLVSVCVSVCLCVSTVRVIPQLVKSAWSRTFGFVCVCVCHHWEVNPSAGKKTIPFGNRISWTHQGADVPTRRSEKNE